MSRVCSFPPMQTRCTLVDARGHELVDQVALRAHDLYIAGGGKQKGRFG